MTKKKYEVDMHCATCAIAIKKQLGKKGFEVEANPALKLVKVTYDETKATSQDIIDEMKKVGYHAIEK